MRHTKGMNVVVIVGDDIGREYFSPYVEQRTASVVLPHLEKFARQSLVFHRAYGMPICSPFRYAALTGVPACWSGIGTVITEPTSDYPSLDSHRQTLFSIAKAAGIRTAARGKWHLGMSPAVGGLNAPARVGVESFQGIKQNPGSEAGLGNPAFTQGYTDYLWITDGESERIVAAEPEDYLTSKTTQAAIDYLDLRAEDGEPFFLWLAYNSGHEPLHAPPEGTGYREDLEGKTPAAHPKAHFRAMLQVMDNGIGEILRHLPPKTAVIYISDNGSSPLTADLAHPERAKGDVYQWGINVPLFVRVPGGRQGEDHTTLVSAPDLFKTVLELLGTETSKVSDLPDIQSFSFVDSLFSAQRTTARPFDFSAKFSPNGVGRKRCEEEVYAITGVLEGGWYSLVCGPDRFELFSLDRDYDQQYPLELSLPGPSRLAERLHLALDSHVRLRNPLAVTRPAQRAPGVPSATKFRMAK